MQMDDVTGCGSIISVISDGCGNAHLHVDGNPITRNGAISGTIDTEISTVKKEIDLIKEEYENKLQRQKVHISGGGRVKGSRIHGRRCKVAIPKRSFRNQKGITGFPNGSK